MWCRTEGTVMLKRKKTVKSKWIREGRKNVFHNNSICRKNNKMKKDIDRLIMAWWRKEENQLMECVVSKNAVSLCAVGGKVEGKQWVCVLSVGRRKVNSKFVCCQWEDRRKIVSCVLAVGRRNCKGTCPSYSPKETERSMAKLWCRWWIVCVSWTWGGVNVVVTGTSGTVINVVVCNEVSQTPCDGFVLILQAYILIVMQNHSGGWECSVRQFLSSTNSCDFGFHQ